MLVRISGSSKKQDGYFDILDYECVNGAGSLGLGGTGVAAGTNGVAQPATPPDPTNPAWIAYAVNTHPAIGGVRLGSVLGATDSRGCVADHFGNENVQSGRVAVRFLASETVEVNVVADLTYSDQQGRARQVHGAAPDDQRRAAGRGRRASRPGTTTSRFRCSAPADSSTAGSKRRTSTRATTASARIR